MALNDNDQLTVGATVTDFITGYTGVITSRTVYLTGPPRYGVERLNDAGAVHVEHFDHGRLQLTSLPLIDLTTR